MAIGEGGSPTMVDSARLRALVALADAMYAEHAAEVQKASDAQYQAEFGHNGPRIAAALGSAGREYVYERHQVSKDFPDMPDAMTALGQRPTTSADPATPVSDPVQGQLHRGDDDPRLNNSDAG